jgi:hypothetical protein
LKLLTTKFASDASEQTAYRSNEEAASPAVTMADSDSEDEVASSFSVSNFSHYAYSERP